VSYDAPGGDSVIAAARTDPSQKATSPPISDEDLLQPADFSQRANVSQAGDSQGARLAIVETQMQESHVEETVHDKVDFSFANLESQVRQKDKQDLTDSSSGLSDPVSDDFLKELQETGNHATYIDNSVDARAALDDSVPRTPDATVLVTSQKAYAAPNSSKRMSVSRGETSATVQADVAENPRTVLAYSLASFQTPVQRGSRGNNEVAPEEDEVESPPPPQLKGILKTASVLQPFGSGSKHYNMAPSTVGKAPKTPRNKTDLSGSKHAPVSTHIRNLKRPVDHVDHQTYSIKRTRTASSTVSKSSVGTVEPSRSPLSGPTKCAPQGPKVSVQPTVSSARKSGTSGGRFASGSKTTKSPKVTRRKSGKGNS